MIKCDDESRNMNEQQEKQVPAWAKGFNYIILYKSM